MFDNGILLIDSEKPDKVCDFSFLNKTNLNNTAGCGESFGDTEAEDYDEPPPSYKLAKYYPKATLCIDGNTNESTVSSTQLFSIIEPLLISSRNNGTKPVETNSSKAPNKPLQSTQSSHIYENIEDNSIQNASQVSSDVPKQNHKANNTQNASSSSRRARFQGLKRQSSLTRVNNNKQSNSQIPNSSLDGELIMTAPEAETVSDGVYSDVMMNNSANGVVVVNHVKSKKSSNKLNNQSNLLQFSSSSSLSSSSPNSSQTILSTNHQQKLKSQDSHQSSPTNKKMQVLHAVEKNNSCRNGCEEQFL